MKRLASLKQRWISIGKSTTAADKAAKEALVEETVQALLCSDEAVDLLVFLKSEGLDDAKLQIESGIYNLFTSDRAAEARELLLHLADRKDADQDYREQWSLPAGKGCPAEAFESFHAALSAVSPDSAQEALFGRNRARMSADSVEAIKSTLEALKGDVKSAERKRSLSEQMKLLPDSADFKAIDQLLPQVDPNDKDSPVNYSRPALLEKWAMQDPAAAAGYVISNPDRFKPAMVAPVSAMVLSKFGVESGVEWVRQFPAGPVFDSAADGAIPFLCFNHPDEARRLASSITDEEIRGRNLQSIEDIQKERASKKSR